MQLSMTARKTTITEGMREAVELKLAFLRKFIKENTDVHVTVEVVTENENKIELLFIYDGVVFKAEELCSDFYFGLDNIADKIRRQISRHKDIRKTLRPINKSVKSNEHKSMIESDCPIKKRKQFNMKPMGELEAIEQMKLLGHSSFMFLNADVGFVMCLLYKRKDGKYGIIEGAFEE